MNVDYKYCIWLVNNQKNNWEKKDKGYQTHMSIKTHLDKKNNCKFNKLLINKKSFLFHFSTS